MLREQMNVVDSSGLSLVKSLHGDALFDKSRCEKDKKWYMIARIVVVLVATTFSILAIIYSISILENAFIGVIFILTIAGCTKQLWNYCTLGIQKSQKNSELAEFIQTHGPLEGRYKYYKKQRTIHLDESEKIKKETALTEEAIEDHNARLLKKLQGVAVYTIKMSWIGVLKKRPNSTYKRKDVATYTIRNLNEHLFAQGKARPQFPLLKTQFADAFLLFEKEEIPPLSLDEVFEIDETILSKKLDESLLYVIENQQANEREF